MYVLFGFLYSLIGIPMILFGGEGFRVMGFIYLFMPILMAVIGFVFFVISASLYNVLAKKLGGMEMEFKDIDGSP